MPRRPTRDRDFAPALLAWFDANRRHLPWRKEPRDPYRVWVSEVMLQQTQVATAVPYFERFVAKFPDVHALAGADEVDLVKAWEGLGLYARVRRMHSTARDVVARGGTFPRSWDALQELHGVGPYMAGAIASLAFGERAPAVDGNVFRVLARFDADATDVTKPAARRAFEVRALALQEAARSGSFNEALMELGATVCTPRAPKCGECPVAAGCRARAAGTQADFPVKGVRKRAVDVRVAAALVERDGRLFVTRPERGLMAGMHAFPYVEVDAGEDAAAALARHLVDAHDLRRLALAGAVGEFRHAYSHRRWHVTVLAARGAGVGRDGEWRDAADVTDLALAGWAKKALGCVGRPAQARLSRP